MKKCLLIIATIIAVSSLFGETQREDEWGIFWDDWLVTPDSVFSDPDDYWFYDTVDLSDSVKFSIDHSTDTVHQGIYFFIAYGSWSDPYRMSYCDHKAVYNEGGWGTVEYRLPAMASTWGPRGFLYIAKYRTTDWNIYSSASDNLDYSITLECPGLISTQLDLNLVPSTLSRWYDIEIDSLGFEPGEFLIDETELTCQPEIVKVVLRNSGDINIPFVGIRWTYQHDPAITHAVVSDSTSRNDIGPLTTTSVINIRSFSIPDSVDLSHLNGTFCMQLTPKWIPPLFDDPRHVHSDHLFPFYHEDVENNSVTYPIRWNIGDVLNNKNLEFDLSGPAWSNEATAFQNGLNAHGDSIVVYLPANTYVPITYNLKNDSQFTARNVQYRFEVYKRKLFEPVTFQWVPLEYSDHYSCSPGVEDSTHWRNIPIIAPGRDVDVTLSAHKFRQIYSYGQDYIRSPVYESSNWTVSLHIRYMSDGNQYTDETEPIEIYFLEDEKEDYYGFPFVANVPTYNNPADLDLWNNQDIIVNATLDEMRPWRSTSALIATSDLRFHDGIDLLSNMNNTDEVLVFTISAGKLWYYDVSGLLRDSYTKTTTLEGTNEHAAPSNPEDDLPVDYSEATFCYYHSQDISPNPHRSIFQHRKVNSGFPVSFVVKSNHPAHGWGHLHFNDYITEIAGGKENALRQDGMGLHGRKPIDGEPPLIHSFYLIEDHANRDNYASPTILPLASSETQNTVVDMDDVTTDGIDVIADASDQMGVPQGYWGNDGAKGVYRIGYKLERLGNFPVVLVNELGYRAHWQFDTKFSDGAAEALFSYNSHWNDLTLDRHVFEYVVTNRRTGNSLLRTEMFANGPHRITVQAEDIEGNIAVDTLRFTVMNGSTIPDSVITSNETWSGNYIIPYDVRIANGAVVTMQAGTVIMFQGDYDFNVEGRLTTNGTVSTPITFRRMHGGYIESGRLKFIGTNVSTLRFTKFESLGSRDDERTPVYGAIEIIGNDNVSFENCTFINCSSGYGGAISLQDADIEITNCVFRGNQATAGGAIHLEDSSPTLIGNHYWNNCATEGSALYCDNSNPLIVNETYRHGLDSSSESTIHLEASSPDFYNTILYTEPESQTLCTVYLESSSAPDFWNCAIPDGQASFEGDPFSGTYSDIVETDPGFVYHYNLGYFIERNSPCVNAGLLPIQGVTMPLYDIAGNPRIDESVIDIGSYEFPQTAGTVQVSGDIQIDTFWSADTVRVVGDVHVLPEINLTILPDVTVIMDDTCDVYVEGIITALGTDDEPIQFLTDELVTTGSSLIISGETPFLRSNNCDHNLDRHASNQRDNELYSYFTYCQFNSTTPPRSRTTHGVQVVLNNHLETTFTNCRFTNPDSLYQGGALQLNNSSPVFQNCTFKDCQATMGGAIYAKESDFQLIGSIIDGNSAEQGGAIYIDSLSAPQILNCDLLSNDAELGGALYCNGSTALPYVVNSILYSNSADYGNQAFFYDYENLNSGSDFDDTGFFYCDIMGGINGIHVENPDSSRSSNSRPNYQSTSGTRTASYLGFFSSVIDADPQFEGENYDLSMYSECINAGTPEDWASSLLPVLDELIIGYPPIEHFYDIGAREKQHIGMLTIGGTLEKDLVLFADTVHVTSNLIIPDSVHVSVDSLVSCMLFDEDVYVQVEGVFTLAGPHDDRVILSTFDGVNDWNGFHVIDYGILNITRAALSNTVGTNGSVIATQDSCNVIVTDCVFFSNQGQNGGCIHTDGGSVRIYNSEFYDNEATNGGVLYNSANDTLVVRDCVFHDNEAVNTGFGGVLFSKDSVLLQNNLMYANESQYGGAIYQYDGDIICINSTICNNDAAISGGGIYFDPNAEVLRNATVNTILWYNTRAGTNPSQITPNEQEIHMGYCNIQEMVIEVQDNPLFIGMHNALIDEIPEFADPDNADYHLNFYSFCIDNGAPTPHYLYYFDYSLHEDAFPNQFSGFKRDVGCYEYPDPPGIEVHPTYLEFEDTYIGDIQSLTFSIRNRGTSPQVYIEGLELPSEHFQCSIMSPVSRGGGEGLDLTRIRSRVPDYSARAVNDHANPEFENSIEILDVSREETTLTRSDFPLWLDAFEQAIIQIDFIPQDDGIFDDPIIIILDSSVYSDIEVRIQACGLDDTQYISQDTTWTGSVHVETHYVVMPDVTLTIDDDASVIFLNNRKIQFDDAVLIIENDVHFTGSDTLSSAGLYFDTDEEITIDDASFTNTRIMSTNSAIVIEDCVFTDSYIEHVNADLTVSYCEFDTTHINAYMNCEPISTDIVTIEHCEFFFSYYTNLISISSYPNFDINNNTMQNYMTALWINESGFGNTHEITDNLIYNNQYGYGIELYHTTADISERNVIHNNYIGLAALRKSVIDVQGSQYYPYQSIHNNYNVEVVFDEDSIPLTFERNLIFDDLHEEDHYFRCVHHAGHETYTVRNNYWSENFDAETHLYPYEYLSHTPVWEPGDSVNTGYNPALELLIAAEYNMDLTNFLLAETQLEQVIEDYPGSNEAARAAQLLLTICTVTQSDYTELQQYYLNEPNLHFDNEVEALADYLANVCNIKIGDYPAAIEWFESIIENPPSEVDSIYATIDIGYTYLLMEGSTRYSGYTGRYPEYRPNSYTEYFDKREALIFQLVTDCDAQVPPIHDHITLTQNFPNPFNPTTTIRYSIPTEEHVRLSVYNIRGQLVTRLVNDSRNAGPHEVIWSGRDTQNMPCASGVYFYRLQVGGKSIIHKMLLLK
ncbi:MAG: T9SS type A sorting domain-containing protein [Candidatus Cloacimonetes bacterium]|nr:T9SS type A sorting domain-containing protein [Candidatus Cloacimonadota bacterium]